MPRCTDCKDTGVIQLLNSAVPCKCRGGGTPPAGDRLNVELTCTSRSRMLRFDFAVANGVGGQVSADPASTASSYYELARALRAVADKLLEWR